jgi:RNA polymerase sigma factor for flagellar operon FliA
VELGTDPQAVHRLVGDVHRATVLNYESIVADGEAEDLLPSGDRPPDHVLVDRERRADLADAVLALPERLRAVVIGYFYEERPVLELAAEAARRHPLPPESPFRQRVRVFRRHRITFL